MQLYLFTLKTISYLFCRHVCICVSVEGVHGIDLMGVSLLLPGRQAWQQVTSPTESSC